jgi:hypothetical protein
MENASNSVTYVDSDLILFDDGSKLYSDHDSECCETHYLDFSGLTLGDFTGLNFDLSSGDFFEKVEDYGIRLLPVNGQPVSVPGYGYNNGYYSHTLTLVLDRPTLTTKFDITECQDVKD